VTGRLAILADDLTGAADTGAAFAAAGQRTVVLLSPEASAPPTADVLVLTSESRALAPEAAAEATRRCARRIAAWREGDDDVRVYKKIDSTLRGHPAIELEALMDTLGERTALVAPAFPAQGRTTVAGHPYVHGVPLEQTTFGQAGVSADLRAVFARAAGGAMTVLSREDLRLGCEHLAGRLAQERGVRLWLADAEDDADLARLAAAALTSPLRVLCGSAGLARAIAAARRQGVGGGRRDGHEGRRPKDEGRHGVLVVAGSRHPATAAQVAALQRRGAVVVCPDASSLEIDDPSGAAQTVARVVDALASSPSVVLSTTGLPDLSAAPVVVAARLASLVAAVCARVRVGGLVLTGGDTASAVCQALECGSLWLTGERQPGIATATLIGGRHPDLPIVTKAGGFGDASALSLEP
jgi:uncharacterized protein YgbK (DUF1537 family)